MTRTLRVIIAGSFVAGLLITATPADARPRPAGIQSNFEANKTFGLGLMLGVPTGLSGKYYLSRNTALDFGFGAYGRYRDTRDSLHLHVDFLWHPVVLAKAEPFWLPLYFGVGGRYLAFDNDFGDGTHLGARVVGGIMMDFERVPLDIFLEFAFVLDIVVSNDREHSDFNGALGVRYYF